jgi:hypothetical protein
MILLVIGRVAVGVPELGQLLGASERRPTVVVPSRCSVRGSGARISLPNTRGLRYKATTT